MGIFLCRNCGYRLEKSLKTRPKICPYCSKESFEEEMGAEDLVKETERDRD